MTSRSRRERFRIRVPGGADGRRMLVVTLVDKCGTGLWTSAVALYFTQVSGLSLGLVGLLVGVSGGIGIAGAPLAGRLADRFPVTRVLVTAQLLRALALLALLTTREFALLLLYSAVGALPDRASSVLTKIYAARLTGPERVRYQAVNRTVANIGWAVGGLAAAVALGFGTSLAYRLLLVGNAASYLVIAALTTRCAEPPAPSQPPGVPAPATAPVVSPASAASAAPPPQPPPRRLRRPCRRPSAPPGVTASSSSTPSPRRSSSSTTRSSRWPCRCGSCTPPERPWASRPC
ncbi:MFS transporter [Streptomyces sp. NPDC059740]|uniref:MFS transporter n=1 Tax=Streptomyces sp. NPDC059740 TaxID=3346926 RepID=UPI003656562B